MLNVFYHDSCLDHNVAEGHPECPERYTALKRRLLSGALDFITPCRSSKGDMWLAALAHDEAYIHGLTQAIAPSEFRYIDNDTTMSSGSWSAVLYALGAVKSAVDLTLANPSKRAFLMHRPPGHHAEADRAMGFCLVNTAAVTARYALSQGLSRIAIVDFDVHHGNGTQAIFYNDSRVGYFSSHEMPLFPGTGAKEERGAGNIYNYPLAPNSDGELMRRVYCDYLLPALSAFSPEMLIFSAGFDAHRQDPLASLNWHEDDFAWITKACLESTVKNTEGRTISVLEGGYNLDSLTRSAEAHLRALERFAVR